MSRSEPTCSRCRTQPAAAGISWCRGCRHRVDCDLGDMPALEADLADTMARMAAALTDVEVRPGGEAPLPYAEMAADALHSIRAFLVGWCRLLHEERGAALPIDTIPAMARHLQRWLGELALHPAAGEFADELRDVTAAGSVAIDLPRDRTRVYVGPCPTTCQDGTPCPGEAWAHFPTDPAARPSIRCRACGGQWWSESWSSVGALVLRRMGRTMPLDAAATRRFMATLGA